MRCGTGGSRRIGTVSFGKVLHVFTLLGVFDKRRIGAVERGGDGQPGREGGVWSPIRGLVSRGRLRAAVRVSGLACMWRLALLGRSLRWSWRGGGECLLLLRSFECLKPGVRNFGAQAYDQCSCYHGFVQRVIFTRKSMNDVGEVGGEGGPLQMSSFGRKRRAPVPDGHEERC